MVRGDQMSKELAAWIIDAISQPVTHPEREGWKRVRGEEIEEVPSPSLCSCLAAPLWATGGPLLCAGAFGS